ncbi:putative bacteriocin ABC transporter, bacteriocin-binding protein, partial [Clostridium botulinum CFSAN001627]
MKPVIQNIDEMKDSREILESKPHPLQLFFLYITLIF